jgi:hypothetical protein
VTLVEDERADVEMDPIVADAAMRPAEDRGALEQIDLMPLSAKARSDANVGRASSEHRDGVHV